MTAAGPALFALEGVRVELGGRPVLADLDLTIPGSGITALVGPSGSGKSTLLRLLNRLISPTRGVVRFRGDDLAELGSLAVRRRVGLVLQRAVPFPGSVADNLRVARPDASGEVMRRALERAALPAGFLDRRADDLSGGEAQRMCIARAIVADPEVLLADEPTSSLDAGATAEVERLLLRLAEDGVPVVLATHDAAQVDRVADRVVVLDAGRLVGGRP